MSTVTKSFNSTQYTFDYLFRFYSQSFCRSSTLGGIRCIVPQYLPFKVVGLSQVHISEAPTPNMKHIFCLLKGEPFSYTLNFWVDESEGIGNLKHLVKEKREQDLGGVDAEDLVVYNVSIPYGDRPALEDSPIQQREIEDCQGTPDELIRFCRQLSKRGVLLYFIFDQYNDLDLDKANFGFVDNAQKTRSKNWLLRMTTGHYLIKGVSADIKAAIYRGKEQRNEMDITIYGGFTEYEMAWWWKHYRGRLPNVTKDDEEEIADITGRIPLLLQALLTPDSGGLRDAPGGQEGRTIYKEERRRILGAKEFTSVRNWVIMFAKEQYDNLGKEEYIQYVKLMSACPQNAVVAPPDPSHFDHRYFFTRPLTDDPSNPALVGSCTCGIARRALARTLRGLGEDFFLEWGPAISANYNNRSALGFTMKEMCLSSISQRGLHAAGLDFGVMKVIAFAGTWPNINPIAGMEPPLELYVPLSYNLCAIDGAIMSLNRQEKLAQLVLLQVATMARPTDWEQWFLSIWEPWEVRLRRKGYQVQVKLLCITEERRSEAEVVVPIKETKLTGRGPRVVAAPQYERTYVTIEDLDLDIGGQLKTARRENSGTGPLKLLWVR